MAARENSAAICSIAFVEIVDYAKKPVDAQMRAKDQFNALVARALSGVPAAERIVLNTAEGVAISFLGNAEACLYFALALRDASASEAAELPPFRTGINAGPVRLVKDPNGRPNLIGDGMSVGQRIVGFAEPNQILASATFHEAISKLDPEYAKLFDSVGTRTDAQVREHALYALNQNPAPARSQRTRTPVHAASSSARGGFAALGASLLGRPPIATALAVALILATAVALRQVVQRPDSVVSTAAIVKTPTPEPLAPAAAPSTKQPAPAEPLPSAPAAPPSAKAAAAPLPPAPPARAGESSMATGTLRLTVVPWGEVYVNGEKAGVAPPLREVALKPGRHRVEIRSPGFATHAQAVDVRAGEEIRIRHRFD